jgi:hypothetical protein
MSSKQACISFAKLPRPKLNELTFVAYQGPKSGRKAIAGSFIQKPVGGVQNSAPKPRMINNIKIGSHSESPCIVTCKIGFAPFCLKKIVSTDHLTDGFEN